MTKQQLGLMGSAGLGAGLGAGLMYLLDPKAGGRRRALARDKAAQALRKGGKAALKTSKRLGNQTLGLLEEAGSKLRQELLDGRLPVKRARSNRREQLGAALGAGAVALGLIARSLKQRNGRAGQDLLGREGLAAGGHGSVSGFEGELDRAELEVQTILP